MGPAPDVAAVRLAVRRSLADLTPGAVVLVACSGGADSLALAAAAAFEAPRTGVRAGAVTVDHQLQAGSAERAAGVAGVLRGLGLAPVEAAAVQVGRAGGPEAAARTARYAALEACARRHRAAAVLLGHTRDDQAETVLLGLARGSGARSLSGMAAAAGPGGLWRRPLLDLERAVLRRACAAEGLTPWDDPHNADPAFTRSRVRHEALPALEAALGPGVSAALARTAGLLRDDADALDGWAADVLARCTAADGTLAVDALEALPRAVRRRVLRRWLLAAGSPASDLHAGHVEQVDRLVSAWRGQGPLHLPGPLAVSRSCGRLGVASLAGSAAGEGSTVEE
jgi:tRNA(Ile)-lysidine synthase